MTAALLLLFLAPAARAQVVWTELPGHSPRPRLPAAVAYDSWRGVTVLYGGLWGTEGLAPAGGTVPGPLGHYEDTWEFDGARWRRVGRQGPPRRQDSAMAFDSRRGVMVLFGGQEEGFQYPFGDTWEFDGDAWRQIEVDDGPDPRSGHAMVFDEVRGELLLFGGWSWTGPVDGGEPLYFRDMWTWDGSEWRLIGSRTPPPGERAFHDMVYDPFRGVVTLWGGQGPDLRTYPGTWEWDGEGWRDATAPRPPRAIRPGTAAGSVFDELRALTLAIGFPDGLEWNGSDWETTRYDGGSFSSGRETRSVYDRARHFTLVFGGIERHAEECSAPPDCPPTTWEFFDDTRVLRNAAAPAASDFDGDGASEPTVFNLRTGRWRTLGGKSVRWTAPGGVPVPGDYDGDGDAEPAIFVAEGGTWKIRGQPDVEGVGQPGDLPAPADYDGDGKTDAAVFRPAEGVWEVWDPDGEVAARLARGSGSPTASIAKVTRLRLGSRGDLPRPADYDGDGAAEPAVYRPVRRRFLILGAKNRRVGPSGAIPVPADYDGDGTADPAVWDPRTGEWTVDGQPGAVFGRIGEMPVPADFDGDGRAEPAVYDPTNGLWRVLGRFEVEWGGAGAIPIAANR